MKLLLRLGSAWVAGAGFAALAASFPPDWKNDQPVQMPQPGLVKFSLPLETLSAARPGLEDLRLFDDTGRELPFLLERPAPQKPVVGAGRNFHVTARGQTTVATFETRLPLPIKGVTLVTPSQNFLKPVTLEGSADGADWQTLVSNQPVFRLANGASQLHLAIPPIPWPLLRITVDDRRSAPIALTGTEILAAAGETAPAEPLGLSLAERDESPGQTRLTLQAAGANVTLAELSVLTDEPLFTRRVTLSVREYAENQISEAVLARDVIYRVAVEGQPPAAKLDLAPEVFLPARELFLTIDNGDSPPLHISGVTVRRRLVHLVFLAAQAGTFHLLSGNPRCTAPRYDLGGLDVKAELLPAVSAAALGGNPSYRPAETLAGIQPGGTAIDVSAWKYRKRLELAREGVQQLELDPEVLSRAGRSFQDLRLVREGKQVPYILERTGLLRSVSLEAVRADDPKRPTLSRWTLKLPQPMLPVVQLQCTTPTTLFKRTVLLSEEIADERGERHRVDLGSDAWVRTPEQKEGKISLAFSQSPQTDRLALEIENGDNPPLNLENFQAWYPATRLLFKAAPGTETYLYYGHPRTNAPRYDLDLVARQLLAAEKNKVALGGEEVLKKSSWSESAAFAGSASWLFWVALGAVVVALLVVIARLLPKSTPPPG